MTDARRRQWISWDVFFNTGTLGSTLREEYGVVGCWVFNSYLCACKKNSVQGRISYTSDAEALAIMGLPGLQLVNEAGEPFTLDDLWTFLARKRQIRRTRRGRITDVISTRWEQWQKPPGKRDEHTTKTPPIAVAHETNAEGTANQRTQKPRSNPRNTNGLSRDVTPDIDLDHDPDIDPDPESERDLDPDPAGRSRTAVDDAIDLHRHQQTKTSLTAGEGVKLRGLLDRLEAMCKAESRTAVRADAVTVIAQAQQQGVPLDVLESAINELGRGAPVLPRAVVPVIQRHCERRGLPTPMFAGVGMAS